MSADSMIDDQVIDDPPVDDPVIDDPPVGVPDLDGFRGLSGCRRDRAYMAVECEVRRLQALQASMLVEVQRSSSFLDDYHHSTRAWLQAVTNTSQTTAIRAIQTAAMFADLALLAAAAAAGEIGADQLRLLTRLHANDRCRDLLPASEELLAGYAKTLTLREFRQICQRWQAHADPDGAHADHQASRHNRSVKTSQIGAGHLFHAEGDALTGDIITEILDAHAQAEFETDLAVRAARYSNDANLYPLARTARQRRYDAFLTIFLKAADTTTTTSRVPLINIFCTQATLTDAIHNHFPPTDPAASPDPAVSADRADRAGPAVSQRLRLCQTASGAPVDPNDLVIAALIGRIRRVVVDSAGRVIDLGRRSRLFTGAAREAVLLSGDRCCWPGCDQRTANIQIDHLDPWAGHGGPTNPYNGGPQCPAHNRHKHNGRVTVTRNHTGWHHHRPDGTEIAPRTNP